jgi:hypothetical protein
VVLGECLRRAALPAMSAGAANRSTCHSGKFHGITARTTPTGSYPIQLLSAEVATGWSARNSPAWSA